MESEIAELRRKRAYMERRLNVTCGLSAEQLHLATQYVASTKGCTAEEAQQELVRQRFAWEAMSDVNLSAALAWKNGLLDAIEQGEPLKNPCTDCYAKTPEARAAKRKADTRAATPAIATAPDADAAAAVKKTKTKSK